MSPYQYLNLVECLLLGVHNAVCIIMQLILPLSNLFMFTNHRPRNTFYDPWGSLNPGQDLQNVAVLLGQQWKSRWPKGPENDWRPWNQCKLPGYYAVDIMFVTPYIKKDYISIYFSNITKCYHTLLTHFVDFSFVLQIIYMYVFRNRV